MKSLWSDTCKENNLGGLKGDIDTDVLIIGGGLAGILCAYMLDKEGISYVLVEANKVGCGITKNTTAKVTAQHGLIFDKLINEFGQEKTQLYLKANLQAVEMYKNIAQDIDCDYEDRTSFVYSLDDREKIEQELKALEQIGYKAELTDKTELPFKVAGAIGMKNQGQFHPLKLIEALADKLNIYENTMVRLIESNKAITDSGSIRAKHIVVATHFPFINKYGGYFLKMYQHRSYVLALQNAQQIKGMYIDESDKGLSFRGYKDLLLLGGGSHRTGKNGGNWTELRDFAQKYYPSSKEMYAWATQDCMTLDGVPYIGKYSSKTQNLYVATGFNKWGMTSSMVSALILRDMLCGRKNPYGSVFSPRRTMLRPQLAINGVESVAGLLSFTGKRCPHLGCGLKWNKYEHSWDCSCHGSRFSQEGKLVDNPAMEDLEI